MFTKIDTVVEIVIDGRGDVRSGH